MIGVVMVEVAVVEEIDIVVEVSVAAVAIIVVAAIHACARVSVCVCFVDASLTGASLWVSVAPESYTAAHTARRPQRPLRCLREPRQT